MPDKARGVILLCNPDCPHCVQAVDRMTEWAIEEGIAVAGLDLRQHPEAGGWLEAEASPIAVFDAPEERVLVGVPTHEAFHRAAIGG